jgi:outer membrane receptor protein involved in Fe transport
MDAVRVNRPLFAAVALAIALVALSTAKGRAQAPADEPIFPSEGYVRLVSGRLTLQPAAPPVPVQPEQPEQPEQGILTSARGFPDVAALLAQAERSGSLGAPAGTSTAISPATQVAPQIDLAGALESSDSVQTVNNQIRNPAALDPRVRAYRYGQIYTQADGAFWMPVRQDLDTPLSMFDPNVVQMLEVVPGPYALQYGPGFSYLNAVTTLTPRYDCFEGHLFFGQTYYGNGDLLNATQRYYGGNQGWGFSILHASRTGNAYTAGDGTQIPAAYNNENLFAQFGFDVDIDRRVEFNYLRQDQTNTQYPGQFFQVSAAVTQGWNLRYIDQSVDGTNPEEWTFQIVPRVDQGLKNFFGDQNFDPNFAATTNGGIFSTGGRLATVYGEDGERQLSVGTDFRYINQYVNENIRFDSPIGTVAFQTGLPRSFMTDGGLFTELTVPASSYWTSTAGARVDWIHAEIPGGRPIDYPGNYPANDPRAQSHVLYSCFLTNEVKIDEEWSAQLNLGEAMRPPTLTELYADGEYIAMLQSGFTRLVSRLELPPERLWQIDTGLSCDYECFRGRITGFYSFIQNFSTFTVLNAVDPTGARIVFTYNTPLATLAGFESYAERDLNPYWTLFGSGLYVGGRDQTLGAPLTQIYPLEGRVGLRLHDPDDGQRWGVELLTRMVAHQHRLGTLRVGEPETPLGLREVVEQPTGGFTVWNIRSYYNMTENLSMVLGINNLFDRNYIEHLSIRFPQQGPPPTPPIPAAGVLSAGFTPYVGVNWTY